MSNELVEAVKQIKHECDALKIQIYNEKVEREVKSIIEAMREKMLKAVREGMHRVLVVEIKRDEDAEELRGASKLVYDACVKAGLKVEVDTGAARGMYIRM